LKEEKDSVQNDNDDNKNIIARYFIITLLLGFVAVGILLSAFKVGMKEKKQWLKVAEGLERPNRTVNPARGNIYSDDDRLMATSAPQYYMYLDFGSEGFNKKGTKKFKEDGFAIDSLYKSKHNNIDSLSYWLSRKLKNRTQAGYKAHLLKGLKENKRNYLIYEGRVSYENLKEIRNFPFLRLKNSSSFFTTKEMMVRQKPFGMLASRTIGDIYSEIEDSTGVTKGKNGLELRYDSLLRGISGVNAVRRVGGRWTEIVEIEPTNCLNIRSTIDINIQDIVEKALTDKLMELDADAGTAVVMEVKTGKIKAITNMARVGGKYYETLNHAVADEIEPGSTFKVAAMMVAIEDRVAEPETLVDVGNGTFQYAGMRMTDHNMNHGGYGLITAEKAIWYSSNIGVAKVILGGYEKNPRKFVEGLHRIGMDADLKVDIPGAGKAKLRWPEDKYWSKTSLPWMSFGYEVRIPPIQTLTFFNAIANDGKMMRPLFVSDILKGDKAIKHFDAEVLISQICSDRTLKIMQNMLYNVVNFKDPTPAKRDGTGKPAKSSVITIAGKTGTAQVTSGGVYQTTGHNVSFCGYFPFESPEYTCIVVISRPRIGLSSGGFMCGTVVKDIAEKIYANSTVLNINKIKEDSLRVPYPEVKNGYYPALKGIAGTLDFKLNAPEKINSEYVFAKEDGKGIEIKNVPVIENLVPNVVGMGAKDAVFALENCGLSVLISGSGTVVSQSVTNGTNIVKGQTVMLTLK
jgi:cell division protein FtsI (penicillin-binding protein 3)